MDLLAKPGALVRLLHVGLFNLVANQMSLNSLVWFCLVSVGDGRDLLKCKFYFIEILLLFLYE
jgi:hypothetical protein